MIWLTRLRSWLRSWWKEHRLICRARRRLYRGYDKPTSRAAIIELGTRVKR